MPEGESLPWRHTAKRALVGRAFFAARFTDVKEREVRKEGQLTLSPVHRQISGSLLRHAEQWLTKPLVKESLLSWTGLRKGLRNGLASALAAFCLSGLGCDPFHTGFAPEQRARSYRTSEFHRPREEPESLRVMTYNIKFGGGRIDFFFDCHGDRVLMEEGEVQSHLAGLARKIRQVDPDLVFLQEADVNSKRSAYVDQVQWLLDATRLNYGVYASQWKADFVPSDGIGAVDSGNAILSKYPLKEATRIGLPLRTDQSAIERYFFLRRNMLRAQLHVPNQEPIWLVGIHAAAFAQDGTKKLQIDRFKQELDALGTGGVFVIGAGDLNTLPPGTQKRHDFSDSVCQDEAFIADDYREEKHWLEALYASYSSAVPLDEYQFNNETHFTHTTDGQGFWNRKLDYIFTSVPVVSGSWKTHQGSEAWPTMPLSDHAPVSVEIDLP